MQIEPDVRFVLERVTCDDNLAVLPPGQLDRKLYEKVNKVLEALGGKWSRKRKGHEFPEDPSGPIETALVNGGVTTAKELGFFATPPELAERMADFVCDVPGIHVLEPSAGIGDLALPCIARGAEVYAIELDSKRRDKLKDFVERFGLHVSLPSGSNFLETTPNGAWPRIIANPPFGHINGKTHLDHLMHMLAHLAPGGRMACVMPSSFMWRDDKRHQQVRAAIYARGGKLEELPEGTFKSSGTMVNTCLVLI